MLADVEATITAFIHENFVFDEMAVPADASLLDMGLVDSTGILEVILFLEETFGITVDDDDVVPENFDSISSLTAYVTSRIDTGAVVAPSISDCASAALL